MVILSWIALLQVLFSGNCFMNLPLCWKAQLMHVLSGTDSHWVKGVQLPVVSGEDTGAALS